MVTFLKRVALAWGPPDKTPHCCLNSVYTVHTRTQGCHPAKGLSAGVAASWHSGWFLLSEQQKQAAEELRSARNPACLQNTTGIGEDNFFELCGLFLHSFATNFLPITLNALLSKLRNKEVSYQDSVNTCTLHGLQCRAVQWTKCLLQIELQQSIWIQA